jgi:hypothetical protein
MVGAWPSYSSVCPQDITMFQSQHLAPLCGSLFKVPAACRPIYIISLSPRSLPPSCPTHPTPTPIALWFTPSLLAACCPADTGAVSPPDLPPSRPTPPVAVLPERATHRTPAPRAGSSRPAGRQPQQQRQQQQRQGHTQASAAGQQRGSSTLPAPGRVWGAAGAPEAHVQQQQQVSANTPVAATQPAHIVDCYVWVNAWWQSCGQEHAGYLA